MKKSKLFLLALIPLCLGGCNKDPDEKESQNSNIELNYDNLVNYGNSFKCTLEMNQTGKPYANMPSVSQFTKQVNERNGNIAHRESSTGTSMTGTLEEAAAYMTQEMRTEVTVDNVASALETAKNMRQLESYTITGNQVAVNMVSGVYSDVYFDFSSGGVLPLAWEVDELETSPTYGKWVGSYNFFNTFDFDLDELVEYAKNCTYDSSKGILSMTQEKAIEIGLIDVNDGIVFEKFEMQLNSEGRIIKSEQIASQNNMRQSMVYTIETTGSCVLPDASLRAPLCQHDGMQLESFENIEFNEEHYHFNHCYDCNSAINIEKCNFNNEGICEKCDNELTKEVRILGPETNKPILYLIVNSVTNKIIDFRHNEYASTFDYSNTIDTPEEWISCDDFNCEAFSVMYTSWAYQFTYDEKVYVVGCGMNVANTDLRTYVLLTDCKISTGEVAGPAGTVLVATITYESAQEFTLGTVYTA